MPRCKRAIPTLIYWLLDIRPETIAAGWHSGKPFYCGKTVETPETRLKAHFYTAKKCPKRKVSKVFAECGQHVKILSMETVPYEKSWSERERHWIDILRFSFPDCANVSAGGDGVPGLVHSETSIAKMRAAALLHGNATSERNRARVWTQEDRENMRAKQIGKRHTPESLAKMSKSQANRKPPSVETREKIRLSKTGVVRSEETRRKISAAVSYTSEETRARIRAARYAYIERQRIEQTRIAT